MHEPNKSEAQHLTLEEIGDAGELPSQHLTFADLKRVPLHIAAELGTCVMTVRDVLELHVGSVIALDKLAGEVTDLYVNDLILARGEVVVMADTINVRISEVVGAIAAEEEEGYGT